MLILAFAGCIITVLEYDDSGTEPDTAEVEADPDDPATTEPDAPPPPYDPEFEAVTWSYGAQWGQLDLSITDRAGLVDCALAQDLSSHPGLSVRQIVARISTSSGSCPTGTHLFADCTEHQGSLVGLECARYRAWDEAGELVADVGALGGAIRIDDTATHCDIQLELSFPNGTFTDRVQIPYQPGPGPHCGP